MTIAVDNELDVAVEADRDNPFTDEELTALALAGDPDQPLAPDAVPLEGSVPLDGLLPLWYMPPPRMGSRKRWHIVLVVLIIAAFLVINLLGLCSTYGRLEVA